MIKQARRETLTTLGGRLKSALAAAGIKQRAIAEQFDVTEQAISQWFRDETKPEKGKIFELANMLGVQAQWLMDGEGPRHDAESARTPATPSIVSVGSQDFTAVGRFDASFSMGPGSLIADDPEPLGYWMVETQWLHAISKASPAELAIVRCSGDSMNYTLLDGDWVLVDKTQRRLSREGIYAIRVGDDAWVKRVSLNIKTKQIRVLSDNPTTPPQPDVDEEDLSIIGRVVALVARKVA